METKMFENLEMIQYCIPVPKDYKENTNFAQNTPKAQHQFLSEKHNPLITFKGNMLSTSFEDLQTNIENQLKKLDSKHQLKKNKSNISYTFHRDNKIFFEKKWLLNDQSVTVTLEQNNSDNLDFFNELKKLYESVNPKCK